MANVNIKFNGKEFLLSCDDGQEESLKNLTQFLDKKYSELKDKLGNIGENKLLLITAVKVMDEYHETVSGCGTNTRKGFRSHLVPSQLRCFYFFQSLRSLAGGIERASHCPMFPTALTAFECWRHC